MKKQFLSIMLFLVCISLNAQENVIKVNPLGILFGTASVSYEKILTPTSSFQVNALYSNINFLGLHYQGYGGGIDYRLYTTKTKLAPAGFYFSPGVSYNFYNMEYDSTPYNFSGLSIKGVAGYQWLWGRFDLDLFAGLNYLILNKTELSNDNIEISSGLGPTLGVSIGYAF